MPRFDRGVVNTKLEKGDIVLMGNPTQYGEILAENILIEDILKADLETLISGSNLVRGKFYRITNAVSSTLSLLVQGLTANTICDYAYNTANGDLVTYNISTDLAGVPFSSVYVPYTGATADVNLGEYQIRVGQLELDQTPTGTFGVGKIRWNDTDGTPEVMLKGANVTLQIGQEQLARVVNKTNTNLTEAGYQVVRISGAQGQRLKVGLAQANSTSTCKDTLGLVTENISNNAEGFITTSGLVRNINTTGSLQGETWADGDRLYLSPSVAGGITNVEPSAPNIVIVLGYVVYAHANQGSIYVSVEGAKALHELFDVSIPTPTNNNVLVYESSTGLWKDKSISTILGFTPIANNATVGGELSGTLPNPSLVTSAVTGKALTGLSVSGSAVVSTDSILTGIGKLQNQINAVVGSVNFQGVWNASTNSPSLASGVGTKGYYYVVSVAGSTNLDGITDWKLGDWAIYDGTAWQKVDNTDAVVSVNGYTGIVTLAKADIGLGNVENTALSTWAGSTNITTLGTIGTGVWNGTAIGDTYISSASTWNAKIGGSGTIGRLAKFTSSGAVGDSIVSEVSGSIGVNVSNPNSYSFNDAALIVAGNTSGNATITIASSTSGIGYLAFADGTSGISRYSGAVEYNHSSDTMFFKTSSTDRLSLSATELITFGATDTGEAHIFGGSARVNGALTVSTGRTGLFSGDNFSLGLAQTVGQANYFYLGTNSSGDLLMSDTNGVAKLTITQAGAATFSGSITTTNGGVNYGGANTYVFGDNSDLYLGTSGNSRIKITSAGLVGIGTTSPSEKLEVAGNVRTNNTNGVLTLSNGNTSGGNKIQSWNAASNADGYLAFEGYNIEYGRFDASGRLGIGTASPTDKFQMNGGKAIFATSNFNGTTTGGAVFVFSDDNNGGKIWAQKNGNSDWGYLALQPSGGNVLIGTTSDDNTNKLQVAGSLVVKQNTSNLDGEIFLGQNTLYRGRIFYDGSINGQFIFDNRYDTTSATGGFLFRTRTAGTPVNALQIAGDGAATFSSSVQATTLKLTSLPTSSAGLSTGDVWNDGGTLKIV